MSLTSLLATLMIALLTVIAPAQSLDELQKGFMENYDGLNRNRDEQLEKLGTGYRGALKRLMEDLQKSGKLEVVLAVHDELTALDTGKEPVANLPPSAPESLHLLHAKYIAARSKLMREHAMALTALADKMQGLLDGKATALTKAGRLDDALAAKKIADSLAGDEGVQAARDLLGASKPGSLGKPIYLVDAKRTILDHGEFYIGSADGKDGVGIYNDGKPKEEILALTDKPNRHLVALPPAKVEFRFARPVREFTTKLHMAGEGEVTCILTINNKLIKRSRVNRDKNDVEWDCKFTETNTLVLEVDPMGQSANDWIVFIEPKAK